ncbi:hypothetical protein TrCOL_g225 [Triparma columacea]|uniref:Glycosyl transferase family 1 domain-containing protein n=1 Tax=Triparma columacea TaxID=722753 RepID=A0A9W7G530_9STRA|nr:hypothetical protein TrCOL_g225 [Triparma columacea]
MGRGSYHLFLILVLLPAVCYSSPVYTSLLNFALVPLSGTLLEEGNHEYIAVLCLPSWSSVTPGSIPPGFQPILPKEHESVDQACISIGGAKEVACFRVKGASRIPPTGFRGEIADVLGRRGSHPVNVGLWVGESLVGEFEFEVYSFGASAQAQGARSGDPMVFITNVPYGRATYGEHLIVDLVVANVGEGAVVDLELTNGEVFEVGVSGGGKQTVTMHAIDPGSHTIEARVRGGGSTRTYFESVLTEREGSTGRMLIEEVPKDGEVCVGGCNKGAQCLAMKGGEKIKILFVGMMKWDGQKTLWKQQFEGLDRSEFDIRFATFMEPSRQHKPEKMLNSLRESGVRLSVRPLPGVEVEVLRETPDMDIENLYKSGGSPNMEVMVNCLLKRLEAAGDVVEKVEPEWARNTWETVIDEINGDLPDLLVFANAREPTDMLLIKGARMAGVKSIVMELPNLYPKFDLDLIDGVIAPSHYAALHPSIREGGGGERAYSLHVVNPGVDHEVWVEEGEVETEGYGWGERCVLIGFVARISSEKSPGIFVQAAKKVREDNKWARFVVVGDGSFRKEMERMVEVMGLGDVFKFTGAIYGESLVSVMRGLDVIVNPSLRYESETFCIANLEAMTMGKALVTFGVGGVGEYARDGVNALVVKGWGEELIGRLAERVEEVVRDGELRRKLGEGGRRTVKEGGFKVEDVVSGYREVYLELVGRHFGDEGKGVC